MEFKRIYNFIMHCIKSINESTEVKAFLGDKEFEISNLRIDKDNNTIIMELKDNGNR
jgi:hypothetical protein